MTGISGYLSQKINTPPPYTTKTGGAMGESGPERFANTQHKFLTKYSTLSRVKYQADVTELVDVRVLGTRVFMAWEFKSPHPHQFNNFCISNNL